MITFELLAIHERFNDYWATVSEGDFLALTGLKVNHNITIRVTVDGYGDNGENVILPFTFNNNKVQGLICRVFNVDGGEFNWQLVKHEV